MRDLIPGHCGEREAPNDLRFWHSNTILSSQSKSFLIPFSTSDSTKSFFQSTERFSRSLFAQNIVLRGPGAVFEFCVCPLAVSSNNYLSFRRTVNVFLIGKNAILVIRCLSCVKTCKHFKCHMCCTHTPICPFCLDVWISWTFLITRKVFQLRACKEGRSHFLSLLFLAYCRKRLNVVGLHANTAKHFHLSERWVQTFLFISVAIASGEVFNKGVFLELILSTALKKSLRIACLESFSF